MRAVALLFAVAPFVAHVSPVRPHDIQYSYRSGCPVTPAQLRVVRLSFWGFDGKRHLGSLVANRKVTGDVVTAVQALKDEPGDELQIWGSSKLLQTLLQHELVDRFRLMTFPLVLGSGRRLFNDGILPATMRPVDLTVTDLGVVLGTYEPAGPVRHGQM